MSSIFSAMRTAILTECLEGRSGSVAAGTDCTRAYADQIRAFCADAYTVPGTVGVGWSGTRANLRRSFYVKRSHRACRHRRRRQDEREGCNARD